MIIMRSELVLKVLLISLREINRLSQTSKLANKLVVLPQSRNLSVLGVERPLSVSSPITKLPYKSAVSERQTAETLDNSILKLPVIHPVVGVELSLPSNTPLFHIPLYTSFPFCTNPQIRYILAGCRRYSSVCREARKAATGI